MGMPSRDSSGGTPRSSASLGSLTICTKPPIWIGPTCHKVPLRSVRLMSGLPKPSENFSTRTPQERAAQ